MNCPNCGSGLPKDASECPNCGEPVEASGTGLYKTSTVMISTEGADSVYKSVADVPVPLRSKLIQSTRGANSGTILIADRRGRTEIARALKNLPDPVQRRFLQVLMGKEGAAQAAGAPGWRRAAAAAVLAVIALVAIAILFAHRW